jgi:hypothetical protein
MQYQKDKRVESIQLAGPQLRNTTLQDRSHYHIDLNVCEEAIYKKFNLQTYGSTNPNKQNSVN